MQVERPLAISVAESGEEQAVSAILVVGTWFQFDESIGFWSLDRRKSLVGIEIFRSSPEI
jgi:hypothetical protein